MRQPKQIITYLSKGITKSSRDKYELSNSKLCWLAKNLLTYSKKNKGPGFSINLEESEECMEKLAVVIKCVDKEKNAYVFVPNETTPVPMEVALMMMVNRPPTCPNIIRLLDWTETASVYIMVIERPFFCQDLSDFMHSQGGKLSEPVAKCFFKQITEAVQYCHFKGVFHNDVKKENILVVTGTFQLKLIDFGCGYFLKDTEYSGHVGTIPYFAPERFLYNTFRAIPSTVWTLGVNLFEMVSGFLPFSSIDDILRNTPPFLFGISEGEMKKKQKTFHPNRFNG
ncbi:serine/threonine-protein kinase pim-2-like isoform X1 [Polypterus senegalus]|uniref:serine/threonine-protein kinase pim-2-like isoform X1 n=1 Tax=Polypterus senegalus TaxID=55291 RepID=UPI001963089E|nr:serine/threonine-protein kinase pim-2-like isoform X1 [Polypterus senegalus]